MTGTGRLVPLALCAILMLVGCAHNYTVECAGPGAGVLPHECDAIAEAVVSTLAPNQLGDLMVVLVDPADCVQLGRASQNRELVAPEHDRCWGVVVEYEGGAIGRSVAHDQITGKLKVFP